MIWLCFDLSIHSKRSILIVCTVIYVAVKLLLFFLSMRFIFIYLIDRNFFEIQHIRLWPRNVGQYLRFSTISSIPITCHQPKSDHTPANTLFICFQHVCFRFALSLACVSFFPLCVWLFVLSGSNMYLMFFLFIFSEMIRVLLRGLSINMQNRLKSKTENNNDPIIFKLIASRFIESNLQNIGKSNKEIASHRKIKQENGARWWSDERTNRGQTKK